MEDDQVNQDQQNFLFEEFDVCIEKPFTQLRNVNAEIKLLKVSYFQSSTLTLPITNHKIEVGTIRL